MSEIRYIGIQSKRDRIRPLYDDRFIKDNYTELDLK